MNREKYHIIKTICFCLIATFIFIFNQTITNNPHILVGSLMVMLGLEDILYKYFTKELTRDVSKLTCNFLMIALGIVCFFLGTDNHFVSLCVIWATWLILRESWEIEETILHYNSKVMIVLSIIESITVIVLSIMFIFEPVIKIVHLHVIILGFELIIEVLFLTIDEQLGKKKDEKTNI